MHKNKIAALGELNKEKINKRKDISELVEYR
jgi:hypothetical protein